MVRGIFWFEVVQLNHLHWLLTVIAVLFVGAVLVSTGVFVKESKTGSTELSWETAVSPGDLSKAHAFLGKDCAACHTANSGVDSAKCITCHADNTALFQQQNTAFHAEIKDCKVCHVEHEGRNSKITRMDHTALSKIGLSHIASVRDPKAAVGKQLEAWIAMHEMKSVLNQAHQSINGHEMALNCATCHTNQDVHRGLMGKDCAACHTTTTWDIATFLHPSINSHNCNECHQAPPSHFMMHFQMVSMKVAGQPHANVQQCYACHQTNDWNDIKAVGWYKHH